MSTTIDQKIVEMQFDNRDFEENVSESMSTIDKLKKSLDFKTAAKGFEELEKASHKADFSVFANAIDEASSSFSNFLRTIGSVHLFGSAVRALDSLEQKAISLVKSLSVDNIGAGWSQYGQKTQSVQTIVAATGKSVDEVNESLEKLIWFTDETSYSFTDMTNNIGKFTSAGVGLEESVNAMMGISNLAAVSGQGISEAGRAMYNFAQALSVGSVKLMDWKSIENANMATVEFKQTIMDTAVAEGTLIKVGDKYLTKQKRTEVTTKNFSQTLNEAWFSSDVLIKSLGKYSSYADKLYKFINDLDDPTLTASEAMEKMGYEVTDLGYKSFRAAQEALTFKQAIDATKDAVSSGWSMTFESIFGNYEEAKKLWTDVANELYDIFATSGNERNDLLSEALGLDHHDKLLKHITDLGVAEEDFNRSAATILAKHGWRLDALGDKYESLEDYVASSDMWATPEIIAETINELSKSYTVAGNTPEKAAKNWEDLQNEIKAAGGDVESFMNKAVELSGDIHFDEFKNFQEWAVQNLTSDLIGQTFSALAEAGTASNEVIKKNSVSLKDMNKLIDDILLGKLGSGQERIDKLTKIGYDAAEVQKLVTKRAKGQDIALEDLDGALKGVTASSEELITYYTKQGKLYSETEGNLHELSDEARTAGTEMYTLSKYFSTESGREFIADAIVTSLQQMKHAIEVVKEAWNDIFPPMTALRLTEILQKIKDLIHNFKLSDEATENLKNTFKGLFSVLSLIKTVIGSVLHILSPILNNIINIRDGILSITGSLGTGLMNVMKSIESFFTAFNNTTTFGSLSKILGEIGSKTVGLVKDFAALFTYNDDGDVTIFEKLDRLIGNISQKASELRDNFLILWNGSGNEELAHRFARLRDILQGIKNLIVPVINGIKNGVTSAIGMLARAMNWVINTFLKNLRINLAAIDTFTFVFRLQRALAVIKQFIESFKMDAFLDSVTRMFDSVGQTIHRLADAFDDVLETLKKVGESIRETFANISKAVGEFGKNMKSKTVLNYAMAVGILAASLWLLGQVEPDRILGAAAAILVLMKALTQVSKVISEENVLKKGFFDKAVKQNVKDLIPFAAAVLLLASAVKKIGEIDLGSAIQGTIAVSVIMEMLAKVLKKMERDKKTFVKGGGTAILMAAAVRILVGAVKGLGELNFGAMMQGVIGVGLVLMELALSFDLLSKNKKKFQTGGLTMLLMAASVRVMKDVVLAFASLDTAVLFRSVAALGLVLFELSAAYGLLSLNKSKIQTGGIVMLMMAASVKILGNIISLLAGIDSGTLWRNVGAIGAILGELVAAYFLLSLNKKIIQTGGIALLLISKSVKTVASVVTAFAALSFEQMRNAIGAMTICVVELMAVYAILANIESPALGAIVGLAAVSLVFKTIGNVIIDVARLKPERLWNAIGALTAGLILAVASLAGLSALGPLVGPIMIGVLALGGIVAEISLLVMAFGGIAQIPGVNWLLNEGGEFLKRLGEAIGKFFGGFAGGAVGAFAASYSASLPEVADNLTHFMERLAPFLESVKKIDESTFKNLKTLNLIMAEVVALASADWIFKLGNKGKSAFTEIGEQMVVFGEAINSFVRGILGVNASSEKAVPLNADGLKIVRESLDIIHGMLSWQMEFPRKEFKAFCDNLRKFALDVWILGPSVAAFFAGLLMVNEAGEPTISKDQIQLIKDTVPIVTDLANTEFKATQEEFAEFGSSMSAFAAELPGLGIALHDFITSANGIDLSGAGTIKITSEDVELVKSAIPIITELAAADFGNATERDLFSTQSKMELFAGALPGFGQALNQFIAGVLGIQIKTDNETGESLATKALITEKDISMTSSAVGLVSQLAEVKFTSDAGGLTTLGEAMTDFGEGLTNLGEPLGSFISGLGSSGFTKSDGTNVPAVNDNSIRLTKLAIEAVKPLTEVELPVTTDNIGNVKTILSTFGADLTDFGPALGGFIEGLAGSGFVDNENGKTIPPVNTTTIKNTKDAIEALRPLCDMELPNVTGLKTWIVGGEGDLGTLASGLTGITDPLYTLITTLGKKTDGSNFDINWSMISLAKQAMGVVSALAEIKVPESAGLLQWLQGGGTLDMFVKDNTLSNLGTQLSAFIRSFSGGKNVEAITNPKDENGPIAVSKAAIDLIDQLAQIKLPDVDLGQTLLGNSLSTFAANLGPVGAGLRALIVNLTNLTTDATTGMPRIDMRNDFITLAVLPAIEVVERLANVSAMLDAKLIGKDMSDKLSKLAEKFPAIGKHLRSFIDGINGVGEETSKEPLSDDIVKTAVEASNIANTLAEAAKNIKAGDGANFDAFGTQLEKFVPHIQAFISGVGAIFDEGAENPINKKQIEDVLSVVPLISTLFSTELPEVSEVDEASGNFVDVIAASLKRFIESMNGIEFTNSNLDTIAAFIESIKSADGQPFSDFVTKLTGDASTLKTSFSGLKADMVTVGQNVIAGLVEGLADIEGKVSSAAYALGTLTKQEIANALGIQSPSTVMRYYIGQNVGAGLEEGLEDSQTGVAKASDSLAGVITDGLQNGIDAENILGDGIPAAVDSVTELDQRLRDIFQTSREGVQTGSALEDSLGNISGTLSESVEDADLSEGVKKAVKKSDLGHAVEDAVSESNVDDVAGFADQVVGAFNSRGQSMRESADGLIATILADYAALSGKFKEAGTSFGVNIADGLRNTSGTMTEAANEIKTNIISDFAKSLNSFNFDTTQNAKFGIVSEFIGDLHDLLMSDDLNITDEFGKIFTGLFDTLNGLELNTENLSAITGFVNDIKTAFSETAGDDGATPFTDFLISLNGLVDGINTLEVDTENLSAISAFATEMSEAAKGISGADAGTFSEFVKQIASAITDNKADIQQAASDLVNEILAEFNGKASYFHGIGAMIAKKIAKGMRDNIKSVREASASLGAAVKEIFETNMTNDETGAPESGRKFVEGLVSGIQSEESKQKIQDALDGLFSPKEEIEGAETEEGGLGGTTAGSQYASQFVEDLREGVTAGIAEMTETVQTAFQTLNEGVDLSSFTSSAETALTEANDRLSEPIDTLTAAFHGIVPDGASYGNNLVQGLYNALDPESDQVKKLIERVQYIGSLIKSAFALSLLIFSPSRVFYGYGENIVQGLTNGIDDSANNAVIATTNAANAVIAASDDIFSSYRPQVKGFGETSKILDNLSAALDDYIDTEPVIRPVMDLSEIDAGAKQVETTFGRAARIQAEKARIAREKWAAEEDAKRWREEANSVTYIQNINSPKAPRQVDIYRATKNMLASVKTNTKMRLIKQ